MKTQKELLLESFSNIKLDSQEFYHYFEGEYFSYDTQNIDHEDENFVIKVQFEECIRWTDSECYDFDSLSITELNIYDKGGDEIFIDATDEEKLKALDYLGEKHFNF